MGKKTGGGMIPLMILRGVIMKRFVEGADRSQSTLLPECLDDWIDEENAVRAIDAFVDALDLANLGFDGVEPAGTGRPAFHPSVVLKLYIYGYLNPYNRAAGSSARPGAIWSFCGCWGALHPTTRRSPTSGRTTVRRCAKCAHSSSSCAAGWAC